jgi:cytochrome oxidase Cu insertion factor (SCO1/SenC/PrrC family)
MSLVGNRKKRTIQGSWLLIVAQALCYILSIGAAEAAPSDDMRALGIVPFNDEAEAPNFMLPTPDGKTVQLRNFKGKVVLLNFWATW